MSTGLGYEQREAATTSFPASGVRTSGRGTETPQLVAAISQRFNEAVEVRPTASEASEQMPLPTDPKTIFLGGLFVLAVLVALYVAAEIVLPVVLAIILKLLLQPFVRALDRLGVPRGIGAVLAITLLVVGIVGNGERNCGTGRVMGRQAAQRDSRRCSNVLRSCSDLSEHLPTMDVAAITGHRHRQRRQRGHAAGAGCSI